MTIPNIQSRNRLLSAMSPDDFALLEPNLERVALDLRAPMEQPNKPIPWVYFMEAGFASVVARAHDGRRVEAGLIGREGVTGVVVVMGDDRSPHETYIQAAGSAQRLGSDDLREAMAARPSIQKLLTRFAQTFLIQTSHTALSNGTAKVEERLARWILMAQDRLEVDELPLTHEFISIMLGVRRPGVTDALHQLESKGLIRATRGVVRVIDREGLIESADGCYGVPESEYERLLG